MTAFAVPRRNDTTGESNENTEPIVPTRELTVSRPPRVAEIALEAQLHWSVVALLQEVVAQSVVSPRPMVGVADKAPKFKPDMVTVPPPECPRLPALMLVRTGASYVSTFCLVPTKALTVKIAPRPVLPKAAHVEA